MHEQPHVLAFSRGVAECVREPAQLVEGGGLGAAAAGIFVIGGEEHRIQHYQPCALEPGQWCTVVTTLCQAFFSSARNPDQRGPDPSKLSEKFPVGLELVVAAERIIVSQGGEQRGLWKALAKHPGDEFECLGGKGAVGGRVLEMRGKPRFLGRVVILLHPFVGEKVSPIEHEIGPANPSRGVVNAALEQSKIAVGIPG